MKPKIVGSVIADAGMTVLLIWLMAFELVGRTAHEWIGAGMFVLFILHHMLNWKWSKNLFRGKYTAIRLFQTVIAVLAFALMIGAMVSAVLISRQVFDFLPIHGGRGFGRIPSYLFLQIRFPFFDFEEPLFFFFMDYLAAMGLFVWIGHYLVKTIRWAQKRKRSKSEG